MACLVVDRVTAKASVIIIGGGVIVCGRFVGLVNAAIVVKLQSVDETGHRHIFVFHPRCVGRCFWSHGEQTVCCLLVERNAPCLVVGLCRVCRFVTSNDGISWSAGKCSFHVLLVVIVTAFGFGPAARAFFVACCLVFLFCLYGKFSCLDFFLGHLHLAVEAHAVAVAEEDVLVVIAVPVLLQHRGNFVFPVCIVEHLGIGNIPVICYTAVFGHLLMIGTEQQMGIVTVAKI